MSVSDARLIVELLALLLTPVFAAGGAWVVLKTLRADVCDMRKRLGVVDNRVLNLHVALGIKIPTEPQ